MRVAYLVNQYPRVSHSFIRREIQALEERGVEVVRLALRGWNGELRDEQDVEEATKTRYVLQDGAAALIRATLAMLIRDPVNLFRGMALAWRMSRGAERPFSVHLAYVAEACRIEPWLRAAGVHHLHAHFGTNSAEVAMLTHVLGGPRWSFTVHGPEEFDKAFIIGLPEKLQRCAFVVAISSYGRSQIYRWLAHRHWSKVNVIACGLEPSYFAGPPIPISSTRRLVCIGRLCEQKGQLLLLEAARRLNDRGISFELIIAGDGEMRRELEAAIAFHQLQEHVRLLGWISGKAVREELLAARALVLPSFAEGLPVVIMEAMALRRPVISTYIAAIPELVQPEEHGWLVPAGDVDALFEAMKACLETPPEVLNRMGAAAYNRVSSRHNTRTISESLLTLFAH
jgi:glycosyltransferase involved in cell wall biosynthesis